MGTGAWEFRPYVRFRWKSADFNNRYYGLEREDPGSAMDAQIAADIRFHVWRNLYLLGRGSILFLDSDTRDISFVDDSTQAEAFLGSGFSMTKKTGGHAGGQTLYSSGPRMGNRIQFE
jgi:outer membrane protein